MVAADRVCVTRLEEGRAAMKGKLLRAWLLLACVALAMPLSGSPSIRAEEKGQDTGMIQCLAASRDAVMSVEFPADGGAVNGQYLVSYTAHDSSPLYDSDGTWGYYDEDRTVTQEVQITGVYSGGAEGSFSNLRVVGTGSAMIDNLQDDRFDRSYRGEIDSPATATWGPGSSLTLGGITATFDLVSINTNDIPNTEWLDPQGFGFPEPTMICKPATTPQTPQDVACFITTDPPELGERDTSFQANVTVTGFDPDADLTYEWLMGAPEGGDVTAQGQNPTITWPYTMFEPNYYTLYAVVTDGGFSAHCTKHFTIGDLPPNNPPECLDVVVVPLPAAPGSQVLGAGAVARDADGDPLHYSFMLMRGLAVAADSGALADPDTHVFDVVGGLQPGPYTVAVTISDGKHMTVCTFQFIVPDFPGGEAAGCGPVGIMYLDDYDVEMNVLAIDAAIEAALAEGGPEYSLIVSHRQRLVEEFGEDGFEQIDGLLNNMRSVAETCPFLLIIGDWDIVPPGVLPNPAPDDDPLITDDVYGDTDHDGLTAIDIPVTRIPDGDSLDLLVAQLSPSEAPEGGNFTIANSKRPHADVATRQVFGADRVLLWSLPTTHDNLDASRLAVRDNYIVLHGSSQNASAWFGEEPTFPAALTVNEANTQGVVLSAACYGAMTYGHTPDDSVALAFLANGSRAFVGSTVMTYAYIKAADQADLIRWTGGRFEYTFLNSLAAGQAPLEAFMSAKQDMASWAAGPRAQAFDVKTLHEMHYYGRP
jgi:hypothetical protein